ncbi:FtsX-like permease family protein [Litorivicinus sp.]|nr:FtsX-like permease family protein [Litorivicinus sp.]
MLGLIFKSMRSRALPLALVTFTLMASMVLVLSIDRIQKATEAGFSQSVSGVDLIIGPKSGSIEMVLYTVFHLGQPINNVTMKTMNEIESSPDIDWLVPIALGDSHKGFRVVATNLPDYFEHMRYGGDLPILFAEGDASSKISAAIVGSTAAEKLGYKVGAELFITHGSGNAIEKSHDDFAFQISGVLAQTGTPIDQAIFVNLRGYELVHLGWQSGTKVFGVNNVNIESLPDHALDPKTVTAAFVGLKSKFKIFPFIREINKFPTEPISAIIPGVALAELWSIVGLVESAFNLLSWMIILICLIAIVTLTIASLDSRKREMTILRANGASLFYLARLVIFESLVIGLTAVSGAVLFVTIATSFAEHQLSSMLGIKLQTSFLSLDELIVFGIILGAGLLSSLIPAAFVYRRNLHQGLS